MTTSTQHAITSADGTREMTITAHSEGANTIYITQIRKTGNDNA